MTMEYGSYKGLWFSPHATSKEILTAVENDFQVKDDDIFNVTYPKSGTTWMIEILSLISRDGDPHWCRTVRNAYRMPWVETYYGWEILQMESKSPRLISSHLPIRLFPKSFFKSKAKVIYTVRYPKDVLVSYYHFSRMAIYFKEPESFEQFLQDFLTGNVCFSSWFDHVWGWTEMKDQANVLIMTYEELQKDLRGSVVRICDFLGKELDEKAIDSVLENASFMTMKDNKMSNFSHLPEDLFNQKKSPFFRKGISGDWKNHFTVEQSERFDRVYQEKMKDLGVQFNWEED